MRVVLAAAVALSTAVAEGQPLLSLPLACTLGETCFVQNFVDVDPGGGWADFACGRKSYDGHDGTDFRVPAGVAAEVLAAADGVVRATRDGEEDRSFRAPLAPPPGRECGNGVIIDHPDGLTTSYCHMARGSVRVVPGQRVARGDAVGRVGASGMTEFRHLHVGVRRGGEELDPFTGRPVGTGCGAGPPLWDPETAEALASVGRTAVLDVGFAGAPVTLPLLEDGATEPATRDGAALVAWGTAIGTEAGDEFVLTLTGPDLDLGDRSREETPKAQTMRFLGKRLRGPLAAGAYVARFEVVRGGTVIARRAETLAIP